MRICHVITRLIIGGAQENTLLTCEGLKALGHDVTLIAGTETGPEGSLWERAQRGGYDLVRLDSLRRNIHPLSELRCLKGLRAILTERAFDVVHTHSSKAGILGRIAGARAGVPFIVHTIHGMSFNRVQNAASRWIYRALERRAAKVTHAFISVADAMTAQATAAGIAPADKFVTIRSGVETDGFQPDAQVRAEIRREWGVREDDIVIGTIARLFANKGYEDILEAMPRIVAGCPRARFVWIGDGAYRRRYLARASALGLADRLHLTGLVAPAAIPRLLNGLDILVHASRWEGLPRAVVQALLMEVPVVCYDNDGAPEVVRPDQTGELVPLGDTAALAEGVVRLASAAERRVRLGAEGRRRCLQEFDHRRMVRQIDAQYRRLAALLNSEF
jgi:glycosyltransferase involved in cell wall biosynthesis